MSDDFEQRLRSGAAQFAADMTPGSADLIRARGDQRRRRKIAGSVALALVVVACGGGSAYALGPPRHSPPPASRLVPAATATPSPARSHPATPTARATVSPRAGTFPTTALHLGSLILRVPATWRVTYSNARGDYTVSTGSCAGDDLIGAAGGSPCPAFSLIADAGPTSYPVPGVRTYVPSQFWTSSSGATGCPAKPGTSWLRDAPTQPYSSGYAPVTRTKTADYTVWQFGCDHAIHEPPSFYFQQRDWYLPESKILIVDEYSTPGLAQILAAATWAG